MYMYGWFPFQKLLYLQLTLISSAANIFLKKRFVVLCTQKLHKIFSIDYDYKLKT